MSKMQAGLFKKMVFSGPLRKQRLAKEVSETVFLLGLMALNNNTGDGALFCFRMRIGEQYIILQDPSMKAPAGALIAGGLHGAGYMPQDGCVSVTSTFSNTFNRFGVNKMNEKPSLFSAITTVMTKLRR